MGIGELRETLAGNLRLQGFGCRALGSPFYGDVLDRMAEDAEGGGIVWDILGPHASASFGEVYSLRLLGGVHRLVLAGDAPDLARHYETAGGDGDADATWGPFAALLAERRDAWEPALAHPPQTNEVGRSVALLAGLLTLRQATPMPVRLLELGASAGLNLLFDRYRYEQDGFAWGDPTSKVRFGELWNDGTPPLVDGVAIDSRRGCDRHPIDVTDPAARQTLMSYVWPGQTRRFELLRDALDIAASSPPPLDRAAITDWLPARIADSTPGVATVVFHSIVWQYLTDDEREAIRATLALAGQRATPDAPLAWLRLEPPPEMIPAEVRLTLWPGCEERLLALGEFHLGPLQWRAG
jgi:hypothetical protein